MKFNDAIEGKHQTMITIKNIKITHRHLASSPTRFANLNNFYVFKMWFFHERAGVANETGWVFLN